MSTKDSVMCGIANDDHAAVGPILQVLDDNGLSYSMAMGRGDADFGCSVFIEGGIDPLKALRVPSATSAITGGTGWISRSIARENLLPARREVLKHVIDMLQKQGATILNQDFSHAPTVDEVHTLNILGRKINLCLMPN